MEVDLVAAQITDTMSGMGLMELLHGKTATHCAQCGAPVNDGEGFRVLKTQVYCSEKHAVRHQENNPL